jgi:hypothetical protein
VAQPSPVICDCVVSQCCRLLHQCFVLLLCFKHFFQGDSWLAARLAAVVLT